jgi:glycosyltransferase involved in cell wall biosynthesis
VLYAKGGRAIEEATRLFPLAGKAPTLGPDQFLLAALHVFEQSDFRLVSVGPESLQRKFIEGQAMEYSLRPTSGSRAAGKLMQWAGLVRFAIGTLLWRPSLILAGIEGPMGLTALLLAKLLRARFIFLVHTDLSTASKRKFVMNRYVARCAHAVIVHGPFLRDQLKKMGCESHKLLEFDTGFDALALQKKSPDDSREQAKNGIFLYAGRIERNKGVFDLLQAFEAAADSSDTQLVFAGDGSDIDSLVQQADASCYRHRISVLGPLPHKELLGWMTCATAIVTPTQSSFPEGRCMSALESLLVGTPVIAPDFGPFPYLVKHAENGLMYAPDSVQALAQALRVLKDDPELLVRLQDGARRSGRALTQPEHTFLSRLREAAA